MNIIDTKFMEWTEALTQEEAKISVFEHIRDIPFAVVPELFSLKKGPEGLLKLNKGFCVPKHYLMGIMFEKLSIPVKYCTYSFLWKELAFEYPAPLRGLAEALPVTYHLACKITVNNKVILADATWDSPLKRYGFPVNEKWDGKSDTCNAALPLEEFIHESADERDRVFDERLISYSLPEKLALQRFSLELNRWLEDIRGRK
ncbi:MAG: hypothetical protein HQ594_00125 [Candidatus Omnitrophica bacterium]|nr:hypothetical protein [Candidatus Omnitrophota bacterium]